MRRKIWLGVGLAVATGSAAMVQAAHGQTASQVTEAAPRWQVADNVVTAGQGGEGGEAGAPAVAGTLADSELGERLAEISAHVWLAKSLNDGTNVAASAEVLKHALENILPQVEAGLTSRHMESFESDLKMSLASAGGRFDSLVLERKISAAEAALKPAGDRAAAHEAAVIAGLAKSAAVEYGEAIVDGRVKEMPEYRFAAAFVREAKLRLKAAGDTLAAKDAKASADIGEGLQALGASLNSLDAQGAELMTPAAFSAIASRLELKASRFTN